NVTGDVSMKRRTRAGTSATLMASTANGPPPLCSCACDSEDSSARQGSHQVAKKCTRTTRPARARNRTVDPARSGKTKPAAARAGKEEGGGGSGRGGKQRARGGIVGAGGARDRQAGHEPQRGQANEPGQAHVERATKAPNLGRSTTTHRR